MLGLPPPICFASLPFGSCFPSLLTLFEHVPAVYDNMPIGLLVRHPRRFYGFRVLGRQGGRLDPVPSPPAEGLRRAQPWHRFNASAPGLGRRRPVQARAPRPRAAWPSRPARRWRKCGPPTAGWRFPGFAPPRGTHAADPPQAGSVRAPRD